MTKIEWPDHLPENVLPDDLSSDPFYESVKAKVENGNLVIDASFTLQVVIPVEMFEDQNDNKGLADTVAKLVIERMLLDTKVDILPLLRRRVEDAVS